MYKDDIIRA